MSDQVIAVVAVLGGSFVLTIAAAAVRRYLGGFDIHSMGDLVIASIAYQISILTSENAMKTLIPNAHVQALYANWWWAILVLAGATYVAAIYPGEVLWANRRVSLLAGDVEAYWHSVVVGFVCGWVLPVVWIAHHIALFVIR